MVRAVAVVATVLLLAGAVLGLTGVTADGVSCGRVFHHSTSYLADTSACADALSGRKAPTVVLLVLGGVAMAAAVFMGWVLEQQEKARRA
jgi:hypothetical protein